MIQIGLQIWRMGIMECSYLLSNLKLYLWGQELVKEFLVSAALLILQKNARYTIETSMPELKINDQNLLEIFIESLLSTGVHKSCWTW